MHLKSGAVQMSAAREHASRRANAAAAAAAADMVPINSRRAEKRPLARASAAPPGRRSAPLAAAAGAAASGAHDDDAVPDVLSGLGTATEAGTPGAKTSRAPSVPPGPLPRDENGRFRITTGMSSLVTPEEIAAKKEGVTLMDPTKAVTLHTEKKRPADWKRDIGGRDEKKHKAKKEEEEEPTVKPTWLSVGLVVKILDKSQAEAYKRKGVIRSVKQEEVNTASVELLGFAISGTEQRGKKVFLYELHVRQGQRGGGIGTALMEMAERTARGADRTMELNVHKDNEAALGYYEIKCGFARCGEVSGGVAYVMRRKL